MTPHLLFSRSARILVIGDVMLDGYSSRSVERISPEAPVPVLRHVDHREVPGGSANVAMNIAALGGRACLIGLIGNDDEGRRLKSMLNEAGVDTRFVVAQDRPTISKTRILAGTHQLLRIDKEESKPLDSETIQELIAAVERELPSVDGVLVSDYQKGVLADELLRQVLFAAGQRDIPVFVDPKRVDFSIYAGASYLTPNRSELRAATGMVCDSDEEARAAARIAVGRTGANILLTRSEHGMALFAKDGSEIILATEAKEIFDVSGAGDTVIATFALAIVDGQPISQALRLANNAAGIVVGKIGTATLSQAELAGKLANYHHEPQQGAVRSWQDACRQREQWRAQQLVVGFTNGCFDIIHPGHIALLTQAARQCDRLIVALNSDESVSRLKGPSRPIQNEQARADVMGAIGCVDMVVLFGEDTPYDLITALQPDVLIKGSDYQFDQIVGAEFVTQHGGNVIRVDLKPGHSTTNIVTRSRSNVL